LRHAGEFLFKALKVWFTKERDCKTTKNEAQFEGKKAKNPFQPAFGPKWVDKQVNAF
jgi:hypothetical protein